MAQADQPDDELGVPVIVDGELVGYQLPLPEPGGTT